MQTLRQYIAVAEENNVAIGHFNISNLDGVWAVLNAAKKVSKENDNVFEDKKIPVVLGVSEGERKYVGVEEIADLVAFFRDRYEYPVFLNADHSYSVETAKQAVKAGFDMAIFDDAAGTYEENVQQTIDVVAYAKEHNPECLIEAEIGYIGGGSNIKDEVPEGVGVETMTKPEEAKKFVEETGVDLIAPSVGNVHGMVKSGNPRLNIERITAVREAGGVPMVLHGGSGVSDEDFVAGIRAGIAMIHVSTELRRAYRGALEESLKTNETLSPYKYFAPARKAMQEAVEKRIRLFSVEAGK